MVSIATVSVLGTGFGQSASAALYDIFFEVSPSVFSADPIATVPGFATDGTLQDFYGYANFSFNNPLLDNALRDNTTHLFMVEASDGLGLAFVHDRIDSGSGGLVKMEFLFSGFNFPSFRVVDDLVSDPVTISNILGTSNWRFTSFNGWGAPFTDGGIIGSSSTASDWSIEAAFVPIVDANTGEVFPSNGISRWEFLSPGFGSTIARVNLSPNLDPITPANLGRKVLIKPSIPLVPSESIPPIALPNDPVPANVPEPSVVGSVMMLGFLGGGATIRRFRQRRSD
jgi:hypothetical protein